MRNDDYKFICETVYRHSSIDLGADKTELVSARLVKRLRATGLSSISEYCNYLRGPDAAEELKHLIDVISTNHTYFFREQSHFEAMRSIILPDLLSRRKQENWSRLRIWSAACSSGEEPYSIGIDLAEYFSTQSINWDCEIEATDISSRILKRAAAGVYSSEAVSKIPPPLIRRHFQVGYGPQAGFHRVKPAIRRQIKFRRLNLLEQSPPGDERFQVIFCRNVMIYFDRETQARLVRRLRDRLVPGGYLLVGHSESLTGLNHGLKTVRPATYQAI